MTLVLSDTEPVEVTIDDVVIEPTIEDTETITLLLTDRSGLSLILSDRNYWG